MACSSKDDGVQTTTMQVYKLEQKALYPETVIYSEAKKKTYIGSYYQGKVITLDSSGNLSDFIVDDSLVAVVGMHINESKNQLFVCNSDSKLSLKSSDDTYAKLAKVMIYDLTTGSKITEVDLGGVFAGGHFLNDITVDDSNNIYVTDSFSPVIYKIDENLTPSVFVQNTLFDGGAGRFGLNGIEYHPDGYLIVGMSNGSLFKVSLSSPLDISSLSLGTSLSSLDGILLSDKNTLLVVSNNLPALSGVTFDESVTKLTSSDNWLSATTREVITDLNGTFPTTLTQKGSDIYVNYGEFSKLIEHNLTFSDFKLQKVTFTK